MRVIKSGDWDGTKQDLEQRVSAFAAAKEAHKFTENVPAPLEEPIVEAMYYAGIDEFVLEKDLPEPVDADVIPDEESDRLMAARWVSDQAIVDAAKHPQAPDFVKRAATALQRP